MTAAAKIHLVSLGCPKNTVDSERMLGLLDGNGYETTSDPQAADVVIVNTCGFIGPAKEESIDAILAAHELRETGVCKGVIVTGCLAERYRPDLRRELAEEADEILTLSQEKEIARYVDRLLGRSRERYIDSAPRLQTTPRHWAYLRISDGCDHQCAFCAIPLIKGRHRSEPVEALVAEAERLTATGARELVLVSQDSVRYGKDLYGRFELLPLLRRLAGVESLEWMRLMYTYPAFWNDELIDFYAATPVMCNYIDMPLQHISDPVLARMKRATTRRKTLDLLERLRSRLPGVGLRSSFIVGFPGETDAQFEELLEFIEDSRFDNATCFIYSPEEGTAAADLDQPVEEEVKEERYRRLTELQDRISAEINLGLVGTRHTALIDEQDAGEEGLLRGRMQRDAPEIDGSVAISAGETELRPGNFAEVEITGAYPYELTARALGPAW